MIFANLLPVVVLIISVLVLLIIEEPALLHGQLVE
jgi:hypothetical protein